MQALVDAPGGRIHSNFIGNFTGNQIKNQIKKRKLKLPESQFAAGAISAASDLLTLSPPPSDDCVLLIFRCVRRAVESAAWTARFHLPRTSLQFIAHHARVLDPHLLVDANSFMILLESVCSHDNRDVARLASRAFDAFMDRIAVILSAHPSGVSECACFDQIAAYWSAKLVHADSNMTETAFAIRSLGFLAGPCKAICGELGLAEFAHAVASRCRRAYCDTSTINPIHLQHIPSFLRAFGQILHVADSIDPNLMLVAQKTIQLSLIYAVKIGVVLRRETAAALQSLLWMVYQRHGTVLSLWRHAVHDALKQTVTRTNTASHGSLLDLTGVPVDPPYEVMHVFWTETLGSASLLSSTSPLTESQRGNINAFLDTLYSEVFYAVGLLPRHLDVSVVASPGTTTDATRVPDSLPGPGDPTLQNASPAPIVVDNGTGIVTTKPNDPAKMENFVEFFRLLVNHSVRDKLHHQRLCQWIPQLHLEWIDRVDQQPLVIPFYTLCGICTKAGRDLGWFDNSDDSSWNQYRATIHAFIDRVVSHMHAFTGDLLVSCLDLLLLSPLEVVDANVLVQPMCRAFEVGLVNLATAVSALDALEYWTSFLKNDVLGEIYETVFPYMLPYLVSESTCVPDTVENQDEVSLRLAFTIENLRRRRFSRMQIASAQDPAELRSIHCQIVTLLGRSGGHYRHILRHTESESFVSWTGDRTALFRISVPFRETHVDMDLDCILPRVMHLAEYAPDRKTKVAAVELFHAVVVLIIGKNAQAIGSNLNDAFCAIWTDVVPAMLRLAVDTGPIAQTLFRPLVLQTVRWFAHDTDRFKHEAMVVIDSVVNAVESDHTALSSLGIECVAEIARYLANDSDIQPVGQNTHTTDTVDMQYVITRLCDLRRRHKNMRQCGSNGVWGKIIDALMKALRGSDSDGGYGRLGEFSLSRLVLGCVGGPVGGDGCSSTAPSLPDAHLNTAGSSGPVQPDLAWTVRWLFGQLGHRDQDHAHQCKDLFIRLSAHVGGPKAVIDDIVSNGGAETLETLLAPNLDPLATLPDTSSPVSASRNDPAVVITDTWLRQFCATTKAYLFLRQSQLMNVLDLANQRKLIGAAVHLSQKCRMLSDPGVWLQGAVAALPPSEFGTALAQWITLVMTILKSDTELNRLRQTLIWSHITADLPAIVSGILFCPDRLGVRQRHAVRAGVDYVACTSRRNTDASIRVHALIAALNALLDADERTQAAKGILNALGESPKIALIAISAAATQSKDDFLGVERSRCQLTGLRVLTQSPWLNELIHLGVFEGLEHQVTGDHVPLSKLTSSTDLSAAAAADALLANFLCHAASRRSICLSVLNFNVSNIVPQALDFYQRFKLHIDDSLATHFAEYMSVVEMVPDSPQMHAMLLGMLDTLVSDRIAHATKLAALCKHLPTPPCIRALKHLFALHDTHNAPVVRSIFERLCIVSQDILANTCPFRDLMGAQFLYLIGPDFPIAAKLTTIHLATCFINDMNHDLDTSIANTINDVIVKQCAVSPAAMDVYRGTDIYSEYIAFMHGVIRVLEHTGSPRLAHTVFTHMCRDDRNELTRHVQRCMWNMGRFITSAQFLVFADTCIDMLYDTSLLLPIRCNMVTDGLISSLAGVQPNVLCEFLVKHIGRLKQSMDAPMPHIAPDIHTMLVIKISCFQIMDVAYTRLPISDLHSSQSCLVAAFMHPLSVTTDKAMTSIVIKTALEAKSEIVPLSDPPGIGPARLKYHQAAYGALAAAVCKTQTKMETFRLFLFSERVERGECHWSNLVDPRVSRDALCAFPWKHYGDGDRDNSVTNPLQASVTHHDDMPSEFTLLPCDRDVLDVVVGAISVASRHSLQNTTNNADRQHVPAFITSLLEKMNPNEHLSIRVFLAKAVLRCADCFKGAANQAWRPLAQLLADDNVYDHQGGTSPLAQEIMIRLVLWSKTDDGKQQPLFASDGSTLHEDRTIVSNMMKSVCSHMVMQNRVDLEKHAKLVCELIACFQPLVCVPVDVIRNHLAITHGGSTHTDRVGIARDDSCATTDDESTESDQDSETGRIASQDNGKDSCIAAIYACSAFVSNHILLCSEPQSTENEDALLDDLVRLLRQPRREIFAAAAELLGQLLSLLSTRQHPTESTLKASIVRELSLISPETTGNEDTEKFIVILNRISSTYPSITEPFSRILLFVLPRLYRSIRAMCLEILCSCTTHLPEMVRELRAKDLNGILSHRDDHCQTHVMMLLIGLIPHLSINDVAYFIDTIVQCYPEIPNERCRQAYYSFIVGLLEKFDGVANNGDGDTVMDDREDPTARSSSETTSAPHVTVEKLRFAALRGLTDDSDNIRRGLINHIESRLLDSTTIFRRLTILFSYLYSPETEHVFLPYAAYFTMEAARTSSAEFSKKLFDKALTDIQFERLNVDTSWARGITNESMFGHRQRRGGSTAVSQQAHFNASRTNDTNLSILESRDVYAHDDGDGDDEIEDAVYGMDTESHLPAYQSAQWTLQLDMDATTRRNLFSFTQRQVALSQPLSRSISHELDRQQPRPINITRAMKSDFLYSLRGKRNRRDPERDRMFYSAQTIALKHKMVVAMSLQKAARDRQVRLLRKYRVGEFPDVQIETREVLEPLQVLAQRDAGIAEAVFCNLVRGISKESSQHASLPIGRKSQRQTPETTVYGCDTGAMAFDLLDASPHQSAPFVGAMLQILLKADARAVDPDVILAAGTRTSHQRLAILVLERSLSLITTSPPDQFCQNSFHRNTRLNHDVMRHWSAIAELHRTMDETDVFKSICEKKMMTSTDRHIAIDLELVGEYQEAGILYKDMMDRHDSDDVSDQDRDMWRRGLLECQSKLAEWQDVETTIVANTGGNPIELIDAGVVSPHLELYVKSQLHLSSVLATAMIEQIAHPKTSAQRKCFETHVPFGVALACAVQGDYAQARYWTNKAVDDFVGRFAALGPSSQSARLRLLASLQKITELNEAMSMRQRGTNLDVLLSTWNKQQPDASDGTDALSQIFLTREIILNRWPVSCEADFNTIRETKLQFALTMTQAAYQQHNFGLAARCISQMRALTGHDSDDDMYNGQGGFDRILVLEGLCLNVARIESMHVKLDTKIQCLANMVTSTEYYRAEIDRLPDEQRSEFLLAEARAFWAILSRVMESPDTSAPSLAAGKLRQAVAARGWTDPDVDVAHAMNRISFNLFSTLGQVHVGQSHSTTTNDQHVAFARRALAQQCDQILRWVEAKTPHTQSWSIDCKEYARIVVETVLASMGLGDLDASDFFPRLLQIIETFPELRSNFTRLSQNVPVWMLLRWLPQMTAVLDKPSGEAVYALLVKVSTYAPGALVFPLQISAVQYAFGSSSTVSKSQVDRLLHMVTPALLPRFLRELRKLMEPPHVFKDWIEQTEQLLTSSLSDRSQRIMSAFEDMRECCMDTGVWASKPGKTFAQANGHILSELCGTDGSRLVSMTPLSPEWQAIKKLQAKSNARKQAFTQGWVALEDYSVWLAKFCADDYAGSCLGVPGQYNRVQGPFSPNDIIAITGFRPTLLSIGSMRRPKRLTIACTDGYDRTYLLKCGEDLRLDQRIEDLFKMMNSFFARSRHCRGADLNIRVYGVVPMTPNLGLIEWVENTKSLRKCMESVSGFVVANDMAGKAYDRFLSQYRGNAKTIGEIYKNVLTVPTTQEVTAHMTSLLNMMHESYLKTFFLRLSASSEAFVVLRAGFAKGWASLSITSYILGIGDRHPENFLVDLKTGGVVGIDFGHAFGSATEILPVPELVPFRLTNQIVKMMHPLGTDVLIELPMVHALTVLRDNSDRIMTMLDIFVKEPLMEWRKFALSQFKKHVSRSGTPTDSFEVDPNSFRAPEWYPQQRLDVAMRKLRGEHPSRIQAMELAWGHDTRPYHQHAHDILVGKRSKDDTTAPPMRASVGNECISVREQVWCLIDQAADPNILGRAWRGWSSWC